MRLTLPVNIPKYDFHLTHHDDFFLMGSCFSQNIGLKLQQSKFRVNDNSFGTIFNPISITNNLERLLSETDYVNDDVYHFNNEKLVNFNNQSSSIQLDVDSFLHQENKNLKKDITSFKKAKTIILTFGTAWAYHHNSTNQIVANCHKLPNNNFTKVLLQINDIVNQFTLIINQLKDKNIIFTVSPVRHSKDGLYHNNLSKSVLHLAIAELTQKFSNCYYFPSYEIVVDELRDYRFYKEDMVHPTNQAIDYVWEKFRESFFNIVTNKLVDEITKIVMATNHLPFNPNSENHQKFIDGRLNKINEINSTYSFIDFSKEKEHLLNQKIDVEKQKSKL